MDKYKTCNTCKQIKSFDEFSSHKGHNDGKASSCKNCISIKKRAIYHQNLDKSRAQNKSAYNRHKEKRLLYAKEHRKPYDAKAAEFGKNWRIKNKELVAAYRRARHAKMLENKVFQIKAKELKRLKTLPCFYCGSEELIEIDHVIPIARGGTHGIGNLISACRSCNRSRQDKTIMEWRIWQRKTP